MANDAYTQQALADASSFRLRLQNGLTKIAWEVLEEDAGVPHHTQRAAYAQRVVTDPANMAISLVTSFVNRPNIFQFTTSYDFPMRSVVTASGDLDIESQVRSDWNTLAGVVETQAENPLP